MGIKEGLKQTNIGEIPIDWDVKPIMSIANVRTGPFGSTLHESDYVREGTPIITVEHLGEQGIEHFNLPMVSDQDKYRLRNYTLKKDDIVFSRVGSVDRNSLIKISEEGWLFSGRLLRIRTQDNRIHSPFLSYYFKTENFKNRIRSVAVGQTMASLNTQIINNIEIAFPPLPEQHAIAEALSDVDALIAAQEALIAKKRAIKQGVMQELLTGKKRLPGFSGEWEEKRLGDLGTFKGGNGFPIKFQGNKEGKYPFYKVSDMNNEGNSIFMTSSNNWIFETIKKKLRINTFPKHTIVFAKIGAAIYLERKKILTKESCIDNNMMGFILDKNNSDYKFMYYLFLTIELGKLVSATALPSLNGKQISELSFRLPKSREQLAISEVLSDLDNELTALELKLDKTKAVKQSMMQELLTGRIRLTGV